MKTTLETSGEDVKAKLENEWGIRSPVLAKFLSDNPLPIIEKSMTLVLEPKKHLSHSFRV